MNKIKENLMIDEVKRPALVGIEGGKSMGPQGPKDWLSNLPVGCRFACRDITRVVGRYELYEFLIVYKTEKTVLLSSNLNKEIYVRVDPVDFCKELQFVEVLAHEDLSSGPKE